MTYLHTVNATLPHPYYDDPVEAEISYMEEKIFDEEGPFTSRQIQKITITTPEGNEIIYNNPHSTAPTLLLNSAQDVLSFAEEY